MNTYVVYDSALELYRGTYTDCMRVVRRREAMGLVFALNVEIWKLSR